MLFIWTYHIDNLFFFTVLLIAFKLPKVLLTNRMSMFDLEDSFRMGEYPLHNGVYKYCS